MHSKGQNTIEFAIIIALLVIAGIATLTLLGNKITTLFKSGHQQTAKYKPFEFSSPASVEAPATNFNFSEIDLGGTPDNPVSQCENSTCKIDFGEFVLGDIPEDFSKYTETAGSAGGTDKLVALIKQIADQLEVSGDTDGANEFRDMANLGHYLARIESGGEQAAEQCKNAPAPEQCFTKKLQPLDNRNLQEVPDNVKNLLSGYDISLYAQITEERLYRVDKAIYEKYNSNQEFEKNKNRTPAYAFADKFTSIMENDKYSDQLKGVTLQLADTMAKISLDHYQKVEKGKNPHASTGIAPFPKYNLLTGKEEESQLVVDYIGLQDIITPKASIATDFNSALICATGQYSDTSKQCN
jgi:Flp pilus assembly pilin Flp